MSFVRFRNCCQVPLLQCPENSQDMSYIRSIVWSLCPSSLKSLPQFLYWVYSKFCSPELQVNNWLQWSTVSHPRQQDWLWSERIGFRQNIHTNWRQSFADNLLLQLLLLHTTAMATTSTTTGPVLALVLEVFRTVLIHRYYHYYYYYYEQ